MSILNNNKDNYSPKIEKGAWRNESACV